MLKKTSAFLLAYLLATAGAAARLGEDFAAYKQRVANSFQIIGEKKTSGQTNYLFKVKVEDKEYKASPGYQIGITVSAASGRITRQAMRIRPGSNPVAGAGLAALHSWVFACESIGKRPSSNKDKAETEFQAFSLAVGKALLGQPQKISYPGSSSSIVLAKDNSGNLVVVVRP